MYLLQLLCLCLSITVCFQLHVIMVMFAHTATTPKRPCLPPRKKSQVLFVCKKLLLPLCSLVSLLSPGFEMPAWHWNGSALEPQACARRQCPGQGEQHCLGTAGARPAAGWFWTPTRHCWMETGSETLGPEASCLTCTCGQYH